jgi:uncharacterized protein (UPF0332 family)
MSGPEKLNDRIGKMVNKAQRSLAVTANHIASGSFDFASSRAYYAAFYMMEAVLLIDGKTFSKHTRVISHFNLHYVKTSIFPKEFGKSINRLFRDRNVGDYQFDLSIDKKDAEEDHRIAKRIVDEVSAYLTDQGFLVDDKTR